MMNPFKNRVLIFQIANPLLKIFYGKKAKEIIKARSNLKISEAVKLAENIPIKYLYANTSEIEKFNDFYGIATVLKQYAKIPNDHHIRAHVEHAISFSDLLFSGEMNCSYPSIILCGGYREKVLKQAGLKRHIYKIGPYIKYAQPLLSKSDFLLEKKRLSKNILAFPQHSTPGIDVEYDVQFFCSKLQELKSQHGYQTARICLYWKDINLKDIYEKEGFEVVTAGHMFDPLFLPRLRSLIELSDFTVSNSVGSHIGYAISLGKPHMFIKQDVQRHDHVAELYKDFDKKFNQSTESLIKEFEVYEDKISARQMKVINHYAGIDCFKTPNELNEILSK